MRSTRWLSRPQRYAASSIVAFAAHWSLACALPTTAPVDEQAKPVFVWLEAAPVGTSAMTGASDQGATNAKTPPVRAQVKRGRDVSRLARAGESPRAASSSAVLDTMTSQGQLELAQPVPETHDAGALQASITGHTAAASDGESGVAAAGRAGMLGFGVSAGRDLVHGPILRAATGCAGYFPADARAGHGEVEIDVTVDARGHARASQVLNEQPWGQGFGVAARGCVRTLSFAPAVDRSGAAISGHAKLRLRFDRPFTT